MSQIDTKIGPKIKAFRRQLGIQANKLAEEMSISPSYLNLIESGKRKIDGDLLLKVCQELKIELSDLTSKSDLNLANNISELLDDQLFEDLDILGPEVQDLVNIISEVDKNLIRSVKVFDVYQGDNIPEDKKSIALNVIIQSSEKTLNDDDLEKINQLIISTVQSKSGAKIRS